MRRLWPGLLTVETVNFELPIQNLLDHGHWFHKLQTGFLTLSTSLRLVLEKEKLKEIHLLQTMQS